MGCILSDRTGCRLMLVAAMGSLAMSALYPSMSVSNWSCPVFYAKGLEVVIFLSAALWRFILYESYRRNTTNDSIVTHIHGPVKDTQTRTLTHVLMSCVLRWGSWNRHFSLGNLVEIPPLRNVQTQHWGAWVHRHTSYHVWTMKTCLHKHMR